MEIVNPITKEHIELTHVDTVRGTITLRRKIHKYDTDSKETIEPVSLDTDSLMLNVFNQLKVTLFSGFQTNENYIDWPNDSELPEYNANYRIFVTTAKVAEISASSYRSLMQSIKGDYIKPVHGGYFLYLDQVSEGHPYLIRDILNLNIEKNPNKTVADLNYNPPA